ncbi:MAG: 50S ribosomal protein L33 [Candidatus Gracilibacteria bacterium]|jgi:ribosomal protein L33
MAKGKNQFATWFCPDCKKPNKITSYNKKTEGIVKELSIFCPTERKHLMHKRKDTRSGKK